MTEQKTIRIYSINVWKCVHTIIGISIMFFGRYLPAPSQMVDVSERLLKLGLPQVDGGILITVSPVGMTVLTLFLGVVYLWATVDTLWPGLLGAFMLGISGYAPMNQVLSQFMGNPMTVMIFFLLIFAAALIRSNISVYLARWLMTLSVVRGRPWALTFVILLACYLVAFLDQTSAVFIMWPAMYVVFTQVGYKKGDTYVSLMIVNSLIMILLSFASDPVKGGAFYLLSNLMSLAASNPQLHVVPINFAAYLLFSIIISLVCLGLLLLIMRFGFRVDVNKLRAFDPQELNREPLPPMTWQQKGTILLFLSYVIWMMLPGIIGNTGPLGKFCSQNSMGGSLMVIFVLAFIQYKQEPLADIAVTNTAYPWRVFFLIAVALLLGNALLNKETNVTLYMEYTLHHWLNGLGYLELTVLVACFSLLLTNFSNSVVVGLVVTPVLLAVCNTFGFAPNPLLACCFYIVLVAAATPAASPFAALLFDNKAWISGGDATRYAVLSSLVVLVCVLFVGIPLANILF